MVVNQAHCFPPLHHTSMVVGLSVGSFLVKAEEKTLPSLLHAFYLFVGPGLLPVCLSTRVCRARVCMLSCAGHK